MKLYLPILLLFSLLSTSCSVKKTKGGDIITSGGAQGGTTTGGTTSGGGTSGGTTTGGTTSGSDGLIEDDGTTTGGTTSGGTSSGGDSSGGDSSGGTTTGETSGGEGGGDEGPTEPSQPPSINSIFIDSPVQGLKYTSLSFSGHTDKNGQFKCNPGNAEFPIETVSFYFSDQDDSTNNDIYLGQIQCRPVVSPMGLISALANVTNNITSLNSNQQIRVKRLLRIIQSLDSDNNPENGIKLIPSEMAAFSDYLDDTFPLNTAISSIIHHSQVTDADFNTRLSTIMTRIGRSGQGRSEASAVSHFNTWKSYCTTEACSFNYTCLKGALYSDPNFPKFSIINPNTGLNRSSYQELLTESLIILRFNEDAELYKLKSGGLYNGIDLWEQPFMRFLGSWTHSASVGLRINNLVFENTSESLTFSQATTLSGTIILDEFSLKNYSSELDREWDVSTNCVVPTNLTIYPSS